MNANSVDVSKAARHLSRRDPIMKQLRAAVGPCTLRVEPDGFLVLTRAIVSQMISTKVANIIAERLCATMPGGRLNPTGLLGVHAKTLRKVGLSRTKIGALRDLADRAVSGALPFGRWEGLTDEEVINLLVQVRGIGRWTAEMFLIFSLGRPDILPVGDWGLRAGVQEQYGLPEMPGRAELTVLAEPWRPFRSVATWYIWRSKGGVPQSDA